MSLSSTQLSPTRTSETQPFEKTEEREMSFSPKETTPSPQLGVLDTVNSNDDSDYKSVNPKEDTRAEESEHSEVADDDDSSDEDCLYSIDDAISHIGMGAFQYRMLLFTGLIWAADAMEMMLLSFLVPKLKSDWRLQRPEDGLISSVVFLGMLFGTAFWAPLSDRIGRRKVVAMTNFGAAVCGTFSALAPSIIWMLFCRFGVGFCVGGSSVAYSLYAEVIPKKNRGEQLVYEQSFWGLGALFSVLIAWVTLTHLSWRWYLIFSAVPLWCISAFYKYIPESPRYLLASGRTADAQLLLQRISEENGVPLPSGRLRPSAEGQRRGRLCDVFASAYRRTSVLMFTIFSCCVFVYYGISFISERYFQETSGQKSDKYWEMVVTTIAELPALGIGAYGLDKWGRKNTMIGSLIIYSFCAALVMIKAVQNILFLGLFFMFAARLTASLVFMAVFIYFSEYYPTVIRTTALGSASALGRVSGIATSFVAEDLRVEWALACYALVSLFAAVCAMLLPIDTTDRDLTDVVDRRQHKRGHIELQEIEIDNVEQVSLSASVF